MSDDCTYEDDDHRLTVPNKSWIEVSAICKEDAIIEVDETGAPTKLTIRAKLGTYPRQTDATLNPVCPKEGDGVAEIKSRLPKDGKFVVHMQPTACGAMTAKFVLVANWRLPIV
jgi:hypothetical protein